MDVTGVAVWPGVAGAGAAAPVTGGGVVAWPVAAGVVVAVCPVAAGVPVAGLTGSFAGGLAGGFAAGFLGNGRVVSDCANAAGPNNIRACKRKGAQAKRWESESSRISVPFCYSVVPRGMMILMGVLCGVNHCRE